MRQGAGAVCAVRAVRVRAQRPTWVGRLVGSLVGRLVG